MHVARYLPRDLPEPLQELTMLALDLRWCWHHGTDVLWRAIDRELWEATANPWLILGTVSDQRLETLATDTRFLEELGRQLAARQAHMCAETSFGRQHAEAFQGHVAYFSMEFGLGESLPIYSGGLGVLAGDHLKTACDLGVPLIGVGLLYQQGYFRQALDAQGEQIEPAVARSAASQPVAHQSGPPRTVGARRQGASARRRGEALGPRVVRVLTMSGTVRPGGVRGRL